MTPPEPIRLSKAHLTAVETEALIRVVAEDGMAAPGSEVSAWEAEIGHYVGVENAVGLSSGTAALHLGLRAVGVGPGDEVLVPTMTFAATAFAANHAGATPVFLDSERASWNLDPNLLAEVLADMASRDALPTAVVPVDLFGRTADYDAILPLCEQYEVPVVVDAAESLGAIHGGRPAGSMGAAAVFSFNSNKIITATGGGMLVSDDAELVDKARYWARQAREHYPWYEHLEVGHNYALSNVLAALGRAQFTRMPEMLARRRAIRDMYVALFADLEGISVLGDPPWGRSNNWLTCVVIDPTIHPDGPTIVREDLARQHIEARPAWKPMHLQPVFADSHSYLTGVADEAFATGLCLPSGVGLTDDDVVRVAEAVKAAL